MVVEIQCQTILRGDQVYFERTLNHLEEHNHAFDKKQLYKHVTQQVEVETQWTERSHEGAKSTTQRKACRAIHLHLPRAHIDMVRFPHARTLSCLYPFIHFLSTPR